VARLVHLRTHSDALAVNDTDFIHVDFSDGKRVRVWWRGQPGTGTTLSLWLTFSDFASANLTSGGEYRVPNRPATPAAKHWREITQQRDIP
jgi:pullulanase